MSLLPMYMETLGGGITYLKGGHGEAEVSIKMNNGTTYRFKCIVRSLWEGENPSPAALAAMLTEAMQAGGDAAIPVELIPLQGEVQKDHFFGFDPDPWPPKSSYYKKQWDAKKKYYKKQWDAKKKQHELENMAKLKKKGGFK